MGYIYRLTFPNGKVYIGQTINHYRRRWYEHRYSAYRGGSGGCRLLKLAIRKYGWENVIKEIIHECDNINLDALEIAEIASHGSLSPDGYNLTAGGKTGKHCNESNELTGWNRAYIRKFDEDQSLPRYIHQVNNKYHCGYVVENHPLLGGNKQSITFLSKKFTLQEKLDMALECLEKLNAGIMVEKTKHSREPVEIGGELIHIPQYIYFIERESLFIVRKPGTPQKKFGNKKMSIESKYNLAVEYLESLN